MRQILPDRVADFAAYYSPKPTRRELSNENYTIVDYLKGLQATRGDHVLADSRAAVSILLQQISIVEAMKGRFTSSLFDIRALVQADLLDNELSAAAELSSKGFARAAGAVAGVALEAHLGEVTGRRGLKPKKAHPTIADFNDLLKNEGAIEVGTWRFIQHLADIRNKCDHKKSTEPTSAEIDDLIAGVTKIAKTVF